MTIRRELIDELLKEYETPKDILGKDGLLRQLTKAVIELFVWGILKTRHTPG